MSRQRRKIEPDLGQKLFFTWFALVVLLGLVAFWVGHELSESERSERRAMEVYPKWGR